MGFRFRRSIGIIPGVRLNLGRRGTSVSLGVRGAHVTVGPNGVRKTVGIPGTGMSYTTNESWGGRAARGSTGTTDYDAAPPAVPRSSGANAGWIVAGLLLVMLLVVIASH